MELAEQLYGQQPKSVIRIENDVSKNNFKHILKKPWINTEAFNYLFKFLKMLVIF